MLFGDELKAIAEGHPDTMKLDVVLSQSMRSKAGGEMYGEGGRGWR